MKYMIDNEPFKQCPMCRHTWHNREDFLADSSLEMNGYTADFESLEYGLFYFTHEVDGCGSTLAMYSSDFLDLYKGQRYDEQRTGKEDCPGYCHEREQLARCDALCECAFVREVIDIIIHKQKTP